MNLRRRNARGFTLIEIMLALAILATIIALTWSTVSSSFRFRAASLDKFERYRAVQQAMDRMSRELSMAFITNIGRYPTNDQGEVTYQTDFIGREDELTFTSLAHVRTRADEPAGEQVEISYRIESRRDEDGELREHLVRRAQAPIDDDPEEGGTLFVMLPDVERVRFEYWDGTREIAGDAWTRRWEAINDHDGALPARVRITIEVPHPLMERETLTFVTQTQIFLQTPLDMLPPDIAEALRLATEAATVGEICDNGVDDDGNGNVDCNDDACLEHPSCMRRGTEEAQ